jgi:hypothetical protein
MESNINKHWYVDAWKSLELIANIIDNSEEYNVNHKNILRIFAIMMPCIECQTHFLNVLDLFDNIENYKKFIWELHNDVNRKLGKDIINIEDYPSITHEHIIAFEQYMNMLFDIDYVKTRLNLFDKQITSKWLIEISILLNIENINKENINKLCFLNKEQYINEIIDINRRIINELHIQFVK